MLKRKKNIIVNPQSKDSVTVTCYIYNDTTHKYHRVIAFSDEGKPIYRPIYPKKDKRMLAAGALKKDVIICKQDVH